MTTLQRGSPSKVETVDRLRHIQKSFARRRRVMEGKGRIAEIFHLHTSTRRSPLKKLGIERALLRLP